MNSFELRIQNDCKQEMYNSRLRILQVNVGFKCNLSCTHCHLECHPARPETMSWETMESVVAAARVVLVAAGTGLKTLNNVIPPYPTRSDAVRQTASLFYVNKFSPRLKKWLVRWFKWRR